MKTQSQANPANRPSRPKAAAKTETKTTKRRGFVLATVMIALTVIVVLTSVLFLYLQTDSLSLREQQALSQRKQWLSKIEQELLSTGSVEDRKVEKYYCHQDTESIKDDNNGTVTTIFYVSTKEHLDSAKQNYLVKIQLKTKTSNGVTTRTITLWEIKY